MTKQENIEELNSLLRLGILTGLSPQTLEAIKEATIAYEEQESILDKIKAEIEQLTSRYSISKERGGMGQVEWSDRLIKESDVLQIIDKYKEEKENG